MELRQHARPRLVDPSIAISGLIAAIEHGSLLPRRCRAICKAIQNNATITTLQRKQDAVSVFFWGFATEQQIIEVVTSGVVSPALAYRDANFGVLYRNFDRAVEALAARDLLVPAGDAAGVQAMFDRVAKTDQRGRARALRSARALLSCYPTINPSSSDQKVLFAACLDGDLPMVRLLLADARVNPLARDGADAAKQAANPNSGVNVGDIVSAAVVTDVHDRCIVLYSWSCRDCACHADAAPVVSLRTSFTECRSGKHR